MALLISAIGPETKNICLLPMARGHCRALLSRWTYDVETGKCIEFKFGGCDGNGNNFASEKVCLDTCAGTVIYVLLFNNYIDNCIIIHYRYVHCYPFCFRCTVNLHIKMKISRMRHC